MLRRLLYGGVIFASTMGLSNCGCDPVPPFIDFSEIDVHALQTEIEIEDTLFFYIDPSNPTYIGQLIYEAFAPQKAFATKCVGPGDQGMKFPIEEMNIISTKDFDSEHPAGSSLNDLFLLKTFSDYVPLSDSLINSNRLNFGQYDVQVILNQPPNLSNEHTFLFELIKSNQEVILGRSEEITWK